MRFNLGCQPSIAKFLAHPLSVGGGGGGHHVSHAKSIAAKTTDAQTILSTVNWLG